MNNMYDLFFFNPYTNSNFCLNIHFILTPLYPPIIQSVLTFYVIIIYHNVIGNHGVGIYFYIYFHFQTQFESDWK